MMASSVGDDEDANLIVVFHRRHLLWTWRRRDNLLDKSEYLVDGIYIWRNIEEAIKREENRQISGARIFE